MRQQNSALGAPAHTYSRMEEAVALLQGEGLMEVLLPSMQAGAAEAEARVLMQAGAGHHSTLGRAGAATAALQLLGCGAADLRQSLQQLRTECLPGVLHEDVAVLARAYPQVLLWEGGQALRERVWHLHQHILGLCGCTPAQASSLVARHAGVLVHLLGQTSYASTAAVPATQPALQHPASQGSSAGASSYTSTTTTPPRTRPLSRSSIASTNTMPPAQSVSQQQPTSQRSGGRHGVTSDLQTPIQALTEAFSLPVLHALETLLRAAAQLQPLPRPSAELQQLDLPAHPSVQQLQPPQQHQELCTTLSLNPGGSMMGLVAHVQPVAQQLMGSGLWAKELQRCREASSEIAAVVS